MTPTAYFNTGKIEENDTYKTITFTANEQEYTVYVSKKTASKSTHIHCRENQTVYWEQLYLLGGASCPGREESVLIRPEKKKDEQIIVLIKGKPGIITGLDENGFFPPGTRKKRMEIFL